MSVTYLCAASIARTVPRISGSSFGVSAEQKSRLLIQLPIAMGLLPHVNSAPFERTPHWLAPRCHLITLRTQHFETRFLLTCKFMGNRES